MQSISLCCNTYLRAAGCCTCAPQGLLLAATCCTCLTHLSRADRNVLQRHFSNIYRIADCAEQQLLRLQRLQAPAAAMLGACGAPAAFASLVHCPPPAACAAQPPPPPCIAAALLPPPRPLLLLQQSWHSPMQQTFCRCMPMGTCGAPVPARVHHTPVLTSTSAGRNPERPGCCHLNTATAEQQGSSKQRPQQDQCQHLGCFPLPEPLNRLKFKVAVLLKTGMLASDPIQTPPFTHTRRWCGQEPGKIGSGQLRKAHLAPSPQLN